MAQLVQLSFQTVRRSIVVAKTTPLFSSTKQARTYACPECPFCVHPFISVVRDPPKTSKVTSPRRRCRLRRRRYRRFRRRLRRLHPLLNEIRVHHRSDPIERPARLPIMRVIYRAAFSCFEKLMPLVHL